MEGEAGSLRQGPALPPRAPAGLPLGEASEFPRPGRGRTAGRAVTGGWWGLQSDARAYIHGAGGWEGKLLSSLQPPEPVAPLLLGRSWRLERHGPHPLPAWAEASGQFKAPGHHEAKAEGTRPGQGTGNRGYLDYGVKFARPYVIPH